MWSFLLRGGGQCCRDSASLSCGRAILVPQNVLLLALTAVTSPGGGARPLEPGSLGGKGFLGPHAHLVSGRRGRRNSEHVALGAPLSAARLFPLLPNKSFVLWRGQEPASNCGTNRPSPFTKSGAPAWFACFFPGLERQRRPWRKHPPSPRACLHLVWGRGCLLHRHLTPTPTGTLPCTGAPTPLSPLCSPDWWSLTRTCHLLFLQHPVYHVWTLLETDNSPLSSCIVHSVSKH